MPRKVTITFKDWAEEFMAVVAPQQFTKDHQANWRSYLNKHLLPRFGSLHLGSIDGPMAYQFFMKMGGTAGAVTRSKVYHCFQRLMGEAERFGYIKKWDWKMKGVGGDKSKKQPAWTYAQALTIGMFMPSYLVEQHVLTVTLGAAVRLGEVCGLNVGDWDPATRGLFVQRQYKPALRHPEYGDFPPPKAGSTGIVFPIKGAAAALDELTNGRDPDAAMFVGLRGRRLQPETLYDAWAAARGSGKYQIFTYHHLRSVGLTAYGALPGVTLTMIQAHGRHRDLASALRYQRSGDEDARRAVSEAAA